MFDTVIVPLDGTPHAEATLPHAIDEARRHAATIVLVHVIPRPEPCANPVRRSGPLPWQGEWPCEDIEEAKRDAYAYLRGVAARYALDPEPPLRVAVGDPGVRVAAEARRWPRPLVVMLTGDRTRRRRPPLSPVTNYLLVAGAVPVLGILPPSRSDAPSRSASGHVSEARLRRTWPGPLLSPSALPRTSNR
jgi:nucleotide-binding universal stress UspA family protein